MNSSVFGQGAEKAQKVVNEYAKKNISGSITLVVGDKKNSIGPLAFTSYLDGYPTLAFTEQQNGKSLLSLVNSHRLGVNSQILLANSNFNDMVIDLAKAESQSDDRQSTVIGQHLAIGQKPILVKLNKKGKGKFTVEDNGIHNVYIESSKLKAKDLDLKIQINGKELENAKLEKWKDNKWAEVAEVRLDKGKHEISVRSRILEMRDQGREELKELFHDMKFVIIPKEKLEEYEEIIFQRPLSYLFYIDKGKIENMLNDEEKLEEVRLKGDSPFRLGKQEFYISEDETYIIKVMLKPKRNFIEGGFVSSSSSSSRASLEAFSGWGVKALNTIYKEDITDDGMHIDAYFQSKGDVREEIVLTKEFPSINIKERPYLALSVEMEDPGIQEVEVEVRFTDPNSWFFKTKKLYLKTDNKSYVVNLYEIAKGKWQKSKDDIGDLIVDKVILKFKKKTGIDLSGEERKKIYTFLFKNIAFLRTQPILAEFKDDLTAYLLDYYYYFDWNGELRRVDFPEQVPGDVKDAYRLHIQRFMDLKEIPVLSVDFPKPAVGYYDTMDYEKRNWPAVWRVVMGLDFDGDEKEDDRIEIFVPAAGLVDGKLLLTVRAYEIAKEKFPDRKDYNLLSIGISHPEDKEVLYQTVMSKKLIRYREHVYEPSDFMVDAGVLELDGKTYNLPSSVAERKKDDSDTWVEFNNIYIERGDHTLKVLENDKFKVEMVEIKPTGSTGSIGFIASKEKQETPKIEFKKINPTRYIVDVKGAKGPFTLVFSESFHEGWKAYIRQVQSSKFKVQSEEPWSALWSAWKDRDKRFEIKDHFVVNGYANGWIVVPKGQFKVEEKEEDIQNFQIVLEYKPQRLFEIGVLISATTLLGCIGYLGYDIVRRRRKTDI